MIIDLKDISGLPLKYDTKKNKLFSKKIKVPKPKIRTLQQMKKVLLDPKIKKPKKLYYMYRDICLPEHRSLIRKNELRYDITIIPPNKLGEEFVKTAGHYHDFVPDCSETYPEVYEVLNGKADYLLQKEKNDIITDVKLVEVKKGHKAVVPPNYGHITINSSDEILIMSNWVSTRFSSIYKPIFKKHGGAYFGIEEEGHLRFIKNNHYKKISRIKTLKPRSVPKFGLYKSRPMYQSFLENPQKFKFLNYPQDFKSTFKEVFL